MQMMRRAVLVLLGLGLWANASRGLDMTWTFAVQLSATVSASPARVELSWTKDPFPVRNYTVARKAVGDKAWGDAVTLSADASSFVDDNVEAGRTYEYQVIRNAVAYTAFGYIAVGLNAPLVDDRGKVIVVVDRSIAETIAAHLLRFEADLAADGWTVVRKEVARDDSPAAVKAAIKAEWTADRERTKAVVLVGHVPVVRSGNFNVDGHGARPMPADVFYGDMDGEWTDANADGIYDQSTLPSDAELMVGRIDFADLPGKYSPIPYGSEVELLRRYFDKNHAFRIATTRPAARALIGNAVGDSNGQAYAATGYRLAALVGASNVVTAGTDPGTPEDKTWIAQLSANDYLWAYGCGAGSDFTVGGIGVHGAYADLWASDFIERKAKATFYLMFGSWFSEWDKPDNLLRTALAAPEHGLAAAWAGRPHLFFHHMGVGEPIGFGIRLSQNNSGLYQNQVQRQLRGVHLALLGDPTLRMQQLSPAVDVAALPDGNAAVVTWKPSRDSVIGYHVYRGPGVNGPFTRITDSPVPDTRFIDQRRSNDSPVYLVRAVGLHASPSGSFHHASQGSTGTLTSAEAVVAQAAESEVTNAIRSADNVWVEDDLPAGASAYASENDRWNWVQTSPTPFSGSTAHQSDAADGLHHHFFATGGSPLRVQTGDTLFAYVYLDPAKPPRQIMLTWLAGHWEHRAYWGESLGAEGAEGTASRRYVGPLPPTGRWIRLEVTAGSVDLENTDVTGMGFTLFDGRATWDRTGKSRP